MKKIILLFQIILIVGCKNEAHNTIIDEVISFMIDKKALLLPPPPALNDTTTVIDKKTIDSLLRVKLKVAVYPTLYNISESEIKTILPDKHQSFLEERDDIETKPTIDSSYSKKGHRIILADTIKLKKSKDYEDFDLLFRFSKLYFNNEKNKVVFSLGISRSYLAGYSALYYLEKTDGKWEIVFQKNLEEW